MERERRMKGGNASRFFLVPAVIVPCPDGQGARRWITRHGTQHLVIPHAGERFDALRRRWTQRRFIRPNAAPYNQKERRPLAQ